MRTPRPARPCRHHLPYCMVSRNEECQLAGVPVLTPLISRLNHSSAGVSESVAPRPGYWPASAHMCGYWWHPRCLPAGPPRLLPEARQVAAGTRSAICLDFGSMGLMGLLPRPHLLAAVLHAAAAQLQRHVLVLTAGWEPLAWACRKQQEQEQRQRRQLEQQQQQEEEEEEEEEEEQQPAPPWLLAVDESVSHDWLLPRCATLLHHGGAGTVAAALRSGIPQLVCPLHFDQQQWAERVVWLGCGAQLRPAALLQDCSTDGEQAAAAAEQQSSQQVQQAAESLAAALASVLEDADVRQQCARMQQQLADEDGAAAAVALIRRQLEQQQQQAQPCRQEGQQQQQRLQEIAQQLQSVELPNGLHVVCHSPAEAAFIHREVFTEDSYLAQGSVTLPTGSIVVDAGETGGWAGRQRGCPGTGQPGTPSTPTTCVVSECLAPGANIGLFALRLLLDPGLAPHISRLHGFEPLPPNADACAANLAAHGVTGQARGRCGKDLPQAASWGCFVVPGRRTTTGAHASHRCLRRCRCTGAACTRAPALRPSPGTHPCPATPRPCPGRSGTCSGRT